MFHSILSRNLYSSKGGGHFVGGLLEEEKCFMSKHFVDAFVQECN